MKKMFKNFFSLIMAIVVFATIIPQLDVVVSAAGISATYKNTYKNTGNHRVDIIGVAKTQIGYREGSNNDTKYGTWYGLPNQPWCAMFISWCARQAGIPTSVLKNSARAGCGKNYFNIPQKDGVSYTPKSGDLFFTKSWSHVGLVYYVDGSYFYTIEGNSNNNGSSEGIGVFSIKRKISDYYFGVPNYNDIHVHNYKLGYEAAHPHKYYNKCSCGDFYYTGKNATMPGCSECKLKTYPKPLKAYTLKTGKTIVYSSINGNVKSNKIYDTDLCTITEFYNNGWCKVTFPLDKGGTDTGYVKTSVFISGKSQNISKIKAANKVNTYKRSDLSSVTGYAAKSDTVYIIGQTDSAVQIAYPLTSGGHKAAWISMSDYKNKICGTKSGATYTITYNANGGKGTMSNTAMRYGTAKNLAPNAFTKKGYTFLGWSTNKSATKAMYTNKQSVKNLAKSGTVTLYAVWKKV